MRKTYIIKKPKVRYELTFIKGPFHSKNVVNFNLVEIRLDKFKGFPEVREGLEGFGRLKINTGLILMDSNITFIKDNVSLIREQWSKNKEDFLESKK